MASTNLDSSDDEIYYSSTEQTQKPRIARTKHKIKKWFEEGIDKIVEQDHKKDSSLAIIEHDPALHPDKAAEAEQEHDSKHTTLQKAKQTMRSIGTTLVNPQKAVKQAAAAKLSSMHKPYELPGTSQALLDAYDDVESESSNSGDSVYHENNSKDQLRAKNRATLKRLEDQRESMHVSWALSHVDRVKSVTIPFIAYPRRKDFFSIDSQGKQHPANAEWIGQLALWYTQNFTARYIDSVVELPFSTNSLRKHVERLLMASAPLQVWAMDIRSIYRWENPRRTGYWLAIWFVVWCFEYEASFVLSCILYYTIRNKYYPRTRENLRASLERAKDHEDGAFQFGEFIDRHGTEDWIAPLLEQMGPFIQLQVNDLADIFEILSNFYIWRSPYQTRATLVFVASCLAVSILTELRVAVKLVSLIAGGMFFFSWPVASRYPRNRLVVSGWRWIVWDIPTHAEWAFGHLQHQCEKVRKSAAASNETEELHDTNSQSSSVQLRSSSSQTTISTLPAREENLDTDRPLLENFQFLSFRCRSEGSRGRLNLDIDGLHFVRSFKHQKLWLVRYSDIDEMRKYHAEGTSVSTTTSTSGSKHKDVAGILELQRKDGQVYTLTFKSARDEIFNYVIGFSRMQWKSLQC